MKVTTIGLDLAKNVFQVHGADAQGHGLLRKQLRRSQMAQFFAHQPPCLVAMEACAGAHYWGRKLQTLGHQVRLIAPQYVKPYVKSQKNDAADAAAICEAATRGHMRFVALKSVDQQSVLALHRLQDQLAQLQEAVAQLERQIRQWASQDEGAKRLQQIPGIGPISASALVASVADARQFKDGRQMSAWMGLVPRQHSSGGKSVLLGITKRGDKYLRTLLIHGARAVLKAYQANPAKMPAHLAQLLQRKHPNVVCVALASRNARVAWAMLSRGQDYQHRRRDALELPALPAALA